MSKDKLGPCWEDCPDCDDSRCVKHDMHVADCDCPNIEAFVEADTWPYLDEGHTPCN